MSCQNAILYCSPQRINILKIQLKVRPIQIYNSYLADAQEFGITDLVSVFYRKKHYNLNKKIKRKNFHHTTGTMAGDKMQYRSWT